MSGANVIGLGLYRRLARLTPPPAPPRRDRILKHITKAMRGVEIGPYHSPLAPKRAGYRCLSLDIFPTEELRRMAEIDPLVSAEMADRIEAVDLVGTAADLDPLVDEGALDYVISSHNLEHLPDPIRFLHACERALRPGGWLSMAIPDQRCCFDYFRWPTTLTEWLEAHFAGRDRPTAAQMFAQDYVRTHMQLEAGEVDAFGLDVSVDQALPRRTLRERYDRWRREEGEPPSGGYMDCHCWAFTPASFEQILLELRFLDLTRLECIEVATPGTNEFDVHLRKGEAVPLTEAEFYPRREALMRRAAREVAQKV